MGMDEEMVEKIHHYEESDLDPPLRLALGFTEAWVRNPHSIDDSFISEMKQHFTEQQIVELAVTIGILEAAHKFNVVFDVEPPTPGLYQTGAPTTPEPMKRHLASLGFYPRIQETKAPIEGRSTGNG